MQEELSGRPMEARQFPQTRWSLVLAAGSNDEEALNELFQIYWFPVYASFRDHAGNHHDAEDLVQRLFTQLHRRRDFEKLDPEKGRFRSYLKAAIKHQFYNHLDRQGAIKRGGHDVIVSIDQQAAEHRYSAEPSHGEDPATLFDRRWIMTILEASKTDLRREYAEKERRNEFEVLEDFLIPNAREIPYEDVASQLGRKPGSVRVAAFRIRKRYRELIRERIAETVNGSQEMEMEFGHLSGLVGMAPEAE